MKDTLKMNQNFIFIKGSLRTQYSISLNKAKF